MRADLLRTYENCCLHPGELLALRIQLFAEVIGLDVAGWAFAYGTSGWNLHPFNSSLLHFEVVRVGLQNGKIEEALQAAEEAIADP